MHQSNIRHNLGIDATIEARHEPTQNMLVLVLVPACHPLVDREREEGRFALLSRVVNIPTGHERKRKARHAHM
jgi:hypothetical protein